MNTEIPPFFNRTEIPEELSDMIKYSGKGINDLGDY
jgi:hypothetical protein